MAKVYYTASDICLNLEDNELSYQFIQTSIFNSEEIADIKYPPVQTSE